MKSLTFELPPSPRCVVQRRTVVIRVQDAWALYMELRDHFEARDSSAPPAGAAGRPVPGPGRLDTAEGLQSATTASPPDASTAGGDGQADAAKDGRGGSPPLQR